MAQPARRKARKHGWETTPAEQVYLAPSPAASRYPDTAAFIRAQWPDEACFLFSRDNLVHEAARFLEGFPGSVAYAVKANPTPAVLEALLSAGVAAFDVASIAEIVLVRSLSPTAELRFNNPVKTRREIARAIHHYGVRHLTIDDERELEKVLGIAGVARVEIAVRFQVERKAGYHDFRSKFGASRADAAAMLRRIHEAGHRPALCFHPGSQCLDPSAYADLIEDAAEIAAQAGVVPSALNVGGGFPVSYARYEGAPLEAFFETIGESFGRFFDPARTRLLAEPGRALVATSMSLLLPVRHRRPTGEVFLGDGLYGTLQELFIAPIRFPYRVLRGGAPLSGGSASVRVYGPTCDPTDVLPEPLELPVGIDEGDYIELGLIGGYGPSTVSRFNGFGTREVVEVDEIFTGDAGESFSFSAAGTGES